MAMDPLRWHKVTEVFHGALACDAASRDVFLDDACQGDATLREEVEKLLAGHHAAGEFGELARSTEISETIAASPGTMLGPYRIESLIGSGGMGTVYKARDTRLHRTVAIKVLRDRLKNDPAFTQRFQREAQAVAQLEHPHICVLHDIAQDNGTDFLVMEYLEGETLAHRLAKGALPVDQVLRYAIEIADALANAHRRGIVHRDLKPANIIITPRGQVKVLDFGLAKIGGSAIPVSESGSTVAPTSLSLDGMVLGTPAYMSPEQARGQPVDKGADIWAFGCVVYEMLAGRRAFAGESLPDVLAAIIAREPDWRRLPPDVPDSVRQLLGQCLQKTVADRLGDIGPAVSTLDDACVFRTRRGDFWHLWALGGVRRSPRC